MIFGTHVVIYSKDADADRAFLRDVIGFKSVDAGHGWLIFALPPGEAAIHPAEENGTHELYFLCDDLKAEIASLAKKNVACAAVQEARSGSITKVQLPGGGQIGIYQPKHPTAPGVGPETAICNTRMSSPKRASVILDESSTRENLRKIAVVCEGLRNAVNQFASERDAKVSKFGTYRAPAIKLLLHKGLRLLPQPSESAKLSLARYFDIEAKWNNKKYGPRYGERDLIFQNQVPKRFEREIFNTLSLLWRRNQLPKDSRAESETTRTSTQMRLTSSAKPICGKAALQARNRIEASSRQRPAP